MSVIFAGIGFLKSPILLTLLILLPAYLVLIQLPNINLRGG
ncbi:hypothetical protein QPX96_03955 [Limosilactobacillus fermentum]|nr:hypothetical protein [Limosilactobacillus fermentum]